MMSKYIVSEYTENPEYRKGIIFTEKYFAFVLIRDYRVLQSSWIRKDNYLLTDLDFTELSCVEVTGANMMNLLTIEDIRSVQSFDRNYILDNLPEEFI